MKFRVILKDSDGPDACVRDVLNDFWNSLPEDMSEDEKQTATDEQYEKMMDTIHAWMK